MLLKGGTHYLLFTRRADGTSAVACHDQFDRALAAWETTGTRVSPIYSLDGAPVPDFRPDETVWLTFCGPIYPGEVEPLGAPAVYLTLGLFNVLFFSRDESTRQSIREFVGSKKVAWEEWEIRAGKLVNAQHRSLDDDGQRPKLDAAMLRPPFPKDNPLCAAGREYVTLIAESISRAARYTPEVARELTVFDTIFKEEFLLPEGPVPVKHGLLTMANAALSRYTSQTYAGTSPILSSECHYWTHSLLGIGIASLALVQIRRFVEQVIAQTRLIERVEKLRERSPSGKLLQSMDPLDPFWDQDFLPPLPTPTKGQKTASDDDPAIPLLTYYSGRDGFRATHLALSSPLELLESSNAISWTLLTLTHEISHILTDGVLGKLLPNAHDLAALRRTVSLLDSGDKAANLLEQVQQLVAYTAWQIHAQHADERIGPQKLAAVLRGEGQNINELITHCFDFLCFYGGAPEAYIPAIWASWSVIPNIEHRISDYLQRSLCALLTLNLRREDGIEITIDQLLRLLEDTKHRFPDALYIPEAIDELKQRRNAYENALANRRPLALFVRHFMHSPDIAQALTGITGVAALTPLEFGPERLQNPLAFIRDHTQDQGANRIRSAWLLQQLAFGGLI